MKSRHETNLDQLRALLEVWRMTGVDEAYALVVAAGRIVADERAWYEHFDRPFVDPQRRPWKVRLALWLIQRQKRHPWRRAWWRLARPLRRAESGHPKGEQSSC